MFWNSRDCRLHLPPEGINLEHASLMPEKREARDRALELNACALEQQPAFPKSEL